MDVQKGGRDFSKLAFDITRKNIVKKQEVRDLRNSLALVCPVEQTNAKRHLFEGIDGLCGPPCFQKEMT